MSCSYNSSPSRDLSYSSLKLDQQAWRAHEARQRFPEGPRTPSAITNGNLRTAIPGIDDGELRQTLPRRYQVDTPQRTLFQDAMYNTKPSLAEEVAASPRRMATMRSSAPKMAEVEVMTHGNPRMVHLTPSTSEQLGPGCYDTDPHHERQVGLLTVTAGERLAGTTLSRDPRCLSAVFASPDRDLAGGLILEHIVRSPPPYLGQDFRPWTSRTSVMSKSSRWGQRSLTSHSLGTDRMCESELSMDGRPATVSAFLTRSQPQVASPSFRSQLPNHGVVLPGQKADPRIRVQSYAEVTAAGAALGPGTYDVESLHAMAPSGSPEPCGPQERHLMLMALLRGALPGHVELAPPQMPIGAQPWRSSRGLPVQRTSDTYVTIPYISGKPTSQRHYLKVAAELRQERAKLRATNSRH